jgi:uncharacterized membrane protein
MSAFAQEWLNLLVRWVHVIAAIMWIGDSFLFMWLDSHITAPTRVRDGDVAGELWMTHSGGFYEVVKRKSLGKDEMPPTLYWFKWESYTTWLSGFLLLVIVFHLNGAALLIDPAVRALTDWQAIAISIGLLPIAYGLYELLWMTPLSKDNRAFGVVGLGLITALAFGLTHVFSARGAFLQVGATLGTIMAANVFFRIIPAQRHMLAMTRAGQPVDTRYGLRAKGRSIQNHYLTLPVLFTMLSNHFPSVYGAPRPWLVLALLFVFGAGLKYVMNKRADTPAPMWLGTAVALGVVIFLTRTAGIGDALDAYKNKPTVTFATVNAIVQARCVTCHAPHPSNPMFSGPPQGVTFDTPANIGRHADRLFVRAVVTRTMPLGNMTGMTDEERTMLGAWFAQGANVNAEGAAQLAITAPPTPMIAAGGDKAASYFKVVCTPCHGAQGMGNGPASKMLNPKPRNFTDAAWQKSVTDEHIKKIILEGGAAVGKSDVMPANPALANDPATLESLVKMVRGFGGAK